MESIRRFSHTAGISKMEDDQEIKLEDNPKKKKDAPKKEDSEQMHDSAEASPPLRGADARTKDGRLDARGSHPEKETQYEPRTIALRSRDGSVVASTLVDGTDYHSLNRWTWRLSSGGYAVRNATENGRKRTIYMHRELLEPPSGLVVDHINRDKLDNRRANLRVTTLSHNNANSGPRRSRTGYRGVYEFGRTGRYLAQISVNGTNHHLGIYATTEEAAEAYDAAAITLHGPLAITNRKLRELAAAVNSRA